MLLDIHNEKKISIYGRLGFPKAGTSFNAPEDFLTVTNVPLVDYKKFGSIR